MPDENAETRAERGLAAISGADTSWVGRCPGGIEAVRAAESALDCTVDLAVLRTARAVVVATSGDSIWQPRPLTTAEQRLFHSHDDVASNRSGTSVRVPIVGRDLTAVLSAARTLDRNDQQLLRGIALMLGSRLGSWRPETVDDIDTGQILAGLRDVVILLDDQFNITWCNDATLTLLGWKPNELIGMPVTSFVHPDDLADTLNAALRLRAAHEVYRIQTRVRNAFDHWERVAITGLDHTNTPGVGGLLLSVRSGDRDTETDRKLDQTERVSASILANLDDAVIVADRVGAITILNDAARRFFNIDPSTPLVGLNSTDFALLHPDGSALRAAEHPLARDTSFFNGELRIDHNGTTRHVCITRAKVDGALDDQIGMVVTFHDITQSRTNATILRNQATHDQLTGLPNRRHLTETLTALDKDHPDRLVAAFMIELDRFKNVNDIHGHTVGDQVIVEVANRLTKMVNDQAIAARVGGDQFIICQTTSNQSTSNQTASNPAAPEFAEHIRTNLAQPFEVDGQRLHLTASVGIAQQALAQLQPDQLLQHADLAARFAKTRGGDCSESFDQRLRQNVAQLQHQRTMAQQALANDHVVVHYQPIVNASNTVIGLEALSRCQTPDGEIIPPAEFIDAIVGTKLIVALDHHALHQACATAKTLANDLWVATNFSPTTLAQSGLAQTVLDAIDHHQIQPRQICIELTETTAFDATPRTISDLRILHAAGVRIALDDFGTGYSSLSHLRDLPLTTVKVDRSFTTALTHPGPEQAIVTALAQLCHSLGLLLIAEGVETHQHSQAIAKLGLHNKQGWAISPALPIEQITPML